MIPAGYMLKSVVPPPGWLAPGAEHVEEICSLSNCVATDFADAFKTWRHNGWWLYDSPAVIDEVVRQQAIAPGDMTLFYYEVHELEHADAEWRKAEPDDFPTHVVAPRDKRLIGFDITTHFIGQGPECSPLSCNRMAAHLSTNRHCLFATFDEAKAALEGDAFHDCEDGPYRIFAVYRV